MGTENHSYSPIPIFDSQVGFPPPVKSHIALAANTNDTSTVFRSLMYRQTSARRAVAWFLAFAVTLVALVAGQAEQAQAAPTNLCYLVADTGSPHTSNDLFTIYNRTTGIETMVDGGSSSTDGTGTTAIEAIAYDAVTSTVYATNAGTFGTIDQVTGEFSAIGSTGFGDVDGLAVHPFTGVVFGAARLGGDDQLIFIDPATGSATGGPVIQSTAALGLADIDDLAIDSVSGRLYGAANGGGQDHLVIIDPVTGAVTDVGSTAPASDMEGLTIDPFGAILATDGNGTGSGDLWTLDRNTGAGSAPIRLVYGDYESVECNLADVNTITGTVFLDADDDATLDPGETGTSGVTVRLYRDVNGDGQVDAGDVLLTTTATDANGEYTFAFPATGEFVVDIDVASLPVGETLTTDNLEVADFGTGFGLTDASNDFGHNAGADLSIAKVASTTTPLVGATVTFTITLSNAGSLTATGVVVEDLLPAGLSHDS